MTNKMREIEKKQKRPMAQILADLYVQHGSQTKVADALGVSQGTVSLWLVKLGLVERTIIVPREQAQQKA